MKRSLSAFVIVFSISCFSSFVLAEDAPAQENNETVVDSSVAETVQSEQDLDSGSQSDESVEPDPSEASLEGLKALVDGGDYEEAYAQGQDMLFDFEGEREFDLLYGTAANEVGESKEAVFIFERLVEDDPSDLRARLELGKAYYQTGEKDKAQFEFETVLTSDQELPENVEARVVAYLNAIESGSEFGDPAKPEQLKAFIGIAVGHDSNANGVSDVDTISRYFGFEGIGGQAISFPNPGKESTAYTAHQIALAYVKPLSERTALDFKVYGSNQNNANDDAVESGSAFFEIGNRWRFEKGLANFSIRTTGVKLNHNDLYDSTQFSASWAQPVAWQFADRLDLGMTTGAIRYSVDSSKDINPTSFHVGITKQVDQLIHAATIQYGMDDAQGSQDFIDPDDGDVIENLAANHYSRDYYGINYSLSYLYDSKTVFHGGVIYQSSSYDEEDRDYVEIVIENGELVGDFTKRDGDMTAFVIGARQNWNNNLQLRASVTIMDVTSDIQFYEYSKNKFEVGAGYQL